MNRINYLSELIKECDSLVDIGCDHAYLCIMAINNNYTKKAYALDINQMPLDNALKNIKKNNLEDKIEVVLSDGLLNFNEELDVVVISGVGGKLICKIISDSIDKFKKANKIILQPNRDINDLRRFLSENGFNIYNEHSLYDNYKYYEIIECYYDNKFNYLTEKEIDFGPILLKNRSETFIKHYENVLKHLTSYVNETDFNIDLFNKINYISSVVFEE